MFKAYTYMIRSVTGIWGILKHRFLKVYLFITKGKIENLQLSREKAKVYTRQGQEIKSEG